MAPEISFTPLKTYTWFPDGKSNELEICSRYILKNLIYIIHDCWYFKQILKERGEETES
jgi:hypothetical protein